jgi:hypothetical protein
MCLSPSPCSPIHKGHEDLTYRTPSCRHGDRPALESPTRLAHFAAATDKYLRSGCCMHAVRLEQ